MVSLVWQDPASWCRQSVLVLHSCSGKRERKVFRLRPWTRTQPTRTYFPVMIDFPKTTKSPLLPIPVLHLANRDIKSSSCSNSKPQLVCLLDGKIFWWKVCGPFIPQQALQKSLCGHELLCALVMYKKITVFFHFLFHPLTINYSLWETISDKRY